MRIWTSWHFLWWQSLSHLLLLKKYGSSSEQDKASPVSLQMPNAAWSPFPFWSMKRGGIQNISEWLLMLHLFLEMLCSAGGSFRFARLVLWRWTRQTGTDLTCCTEVVCVFIPSYTGARNTLDFGWEQTSSPLTSQDKTWVKTVWPFTWLEFNRWVVCGYV